MSQRVLVSGGAGVIARELLELLSARGASVLSVDRLPLPGAAPPGVEHLRGDLAEMDLAPLAAFRPEVVYHLAATFERSIESPEFWDQGWADNVVVTHRLIDAAATMPDLGAFVFASSYLVYRTAQYLSDAPRDAAVALGEDASILPRNLCGAAKLYAEAELAFARSVQSRWFRTVSARIFRVYGRGSRDVVSRWVRAALRDEPIDLYHGRNRFDYVFSRDVAEGLIRLADARDAEGPVNLATGRAREVREVLQVIQQATGASLDVREADVDEPYEASQADTRRLRDMTGWQPTTTLESGVATLVAHEREAAGVG
ncbi:MAG TPA: NAD-dependent epimerase/dehydratase family protein [Candidatus Limnocylindrales bacterium]|nr:NAD-dependent epimerase/dehydratase family protein [Candidatus Limnocylindrales bacterium]